MNSACLFSGGKDSALALHRAIEQGIKIDLLLTMKSKNQFSYMFHYPNIETTRLQAEALGIKQVFVETKGIKEEELADLERALLENNVKVLVTGAVASTYQKDRIEAIGKKLGIDVISPLWHIEPVKELKELTENFEVIITQVSAEGLDETFLGKRIDSEMIERLKAVSKKHGINMLFEGGEAETFVLDAPLFKKRIVIDQAKMVREGQIGRYLINRAHPEEKNRDR
ncbi:MAG: diphthine--ammonia ligase [Candidatus Micrarchaeota archaeon]|nr:diphthine--ammonia ligase [Candidatus Micrarchaeota archaeon]MDE1864411.1 diphthine--ammonia ligase [Candidatus Micrarchaeota archaeon]